MVAFICVYWLIYEHVYKHWMCAWCVWCVPVCMGVYTCVYEDRHQSGCWASSSITLHLVFMKGSLSLNQKLLLLPRLSKSSQDLAVILPSPQLCHAGILCGCWRLELSFCSLTESDITYQPVSRSHWKHLSLYLYYLIVWVHSNWKVMTNTFQKNTVDYGCLPALWKYTFKKILKSCLKVLELCMHFLSIDFTQ